MEFVIIYNRTQLLWTLAVTPIISSGLVPSGKFVENCTKLICLEITGYRIKYSTVLWLLELQIRRGRKV